MSSTRTYGASWIGVDLDATLAEHTRWQGHDHIGSPIAAMVARVQRWLDDGHTVKIFTARMANDNSDAIEARIQRWLVEEAKLPPLECTCVKDMGMIELYDDRAVQVIPNTGLLLFDVSKANGVQQ